MPQLNEPKSFKFGNAEIIIHRMVSYYQRFEQHHEVLISIRGSVQEFYLKNEVLDLVAYNVGQNLFHNPPLSREVSGEEPIGRNEAYELKWTQRLI